MAKFRSIVVVKPEDGKLGHTVFVPAQDKETGKYDDAAYLEPVVEDALHRKMLINPDTEKPFTSVEELNNFREKVKAKYKILSREAEKKRRSF